MAEKKLIDWQEVRGWTWHKRLFEKHGLVDSHTMAAALHEAERKANRLLEREGHAALADWLWRQDEARAVLNVPEEAIGHLWEGSRAAASGRSRPRRFLVDFYGVDNLEPLEYLALHKDVSPRLWVRRERLKLTRRQVAEASDGFPHIAFMALPMTADPDSSRSDPDAVYVWGMEFGLNPWWRQETLAAATRISRLSTDGMAKAAGESGWLVPAGPETKGFWDIVGRQRKMTTWRVLGTDPWEEEHMQYSVEMPELGAIPFYHTSQLPELHAAAVHGQVKLSLMGPLADSHFKKGKIQELRERFGYPRVETRGRWRRDMAKVAEVSRLVEEQRLSKYQAAKRLGMKRSTLYDYLKEAERTRQTRDA